MRLRISVPKNEIGSRTDYRGPTFTVHSRVKSQVGQARIILMTQKYLSASVIAYIPPRSIRTEVSWPSHCG